MKRTGILEDFETGRLKDLETLDFRLQMSDFRLLISLSLPVS